jgi:hypothetical protein
MTACGHKRREVDKSKNRGMINVIVIPDSDLEAGDAMIVRKRCVCGACLSCLATFALQDQRSLMADDFRVFVLSSEQLSTCFLQLDSISQCPRQIPDAANTLPNVYNQSPRFSNPCTVTIPRPPGRYKPVACASPMTECGLPVRREDPVRGARRGETVPSMLLTLSTATNTPLAPHPHRRARSAA